MPSKLQQVMAERRTFLQDEILLRLDASSVLNHHELDEELVRERVARLMDNFLASLDETPEVFVSYVESIIEERIDEGIILHELQLALTVLEEKAWQLVIELIPLKNQVRCLGMITLIIGTAKDRVAHVLLHHLEMVESEVNFLRRRSGFLELGADSPAIPVVDLNWQRGSVKPPHELV